MTRPRFVWEPLRMTWQEVAETAFRRSEGWLRDHIPNDFPRPVDNLFAVEAVRQWVRERHGLATGPETAKDAERRMMARIGDGKGAGAVPRRPAA